MTQTSRTLFPQASEAAHSDIYRVLNEGKASVCQQLGVCPQCCERFEPLFGKHVCRQPEAKPVGYLSVYESVALTDVLCTGCHSFAAKIVPLFPQNLNQYRQPCSCCGKEINPNADPRWPVLFE